ncbi:MAG: XRE family transcriptional regulator [Epsilonproteobacteria bacterium]|jgi:transcriptional regulator with XRE-family HTH domain|nr:XRE family transcriptional regulator [Campylobacterota bacterium]
MNLIDIEHIHQQIGKNVAKFRKERNMSQLDLSLKLGHKSVSIVASAERFYKRKHFNIEHLIRIASILNIDICEFFKPIE